MKFKRTTLIVVVSRFISNGLGFVGTIYYARELGPGVLGSFFLLQSLIGILGIPADLGVQGALEKRISEGGDENQLYAASLLFIAISFIAVFLISLLLRDQINNYIGASLFWELIVLLLAAIITRLYLSVLRGELKVIQSALLRAFKALFTLATAVALLIIGFHIYALIYGILVGHVMTILLSVYIIGLSPKKPGIEHFNQIFSFSKYNTLLQTSGLIYSWTDIVVIGWFLSNSAVGVYEIAWRVSMVSIIASDAISNIIFPNFSDLHAKGQLSEIGDTLSRAITYSIIIPIGIFFGSILLSEDLLLTIYGPTFASGASVLIILLGERIIHSFYKSLFNVTMAFDQPNIAFRISLISIFLNIALNIALVPIIGIEGAALAMLAAYVISSVLYYQHVRQKISFNLPIRNILWMTSAGTLMTISISLVEQIVNGYSLGTLLIIITTGGLLYLGIVLMKTNIKIPDNTLRQIW